MTVKVETNLPNEHNTSSASGLLMGRKKSSWEEKFFTVEKRKLWLQSPENGKPAFVGAESVQNVVL